MISFFRIQIVPQLLQKLVQSFTKLPKVHVILILMFLSGCQSIFDFSPYEIRLEKGDKDTTSKNLSKIKKNNSATDSLIVVVTGDSHCEFNNLRKTVKSINSNYRVDFVLSVGDMADLGLQKEFELFHDEMEKLEMPYLTVIGNHDYRSNGGEIYRQMFGVFNYSFKVGFLRVICFDDIFWESNATPDFNWLETELKTYKGEIILVVAHIPPDTDQFDESSRSKYLELMNKYDVKFSFHGHQHQFEFKVIDETLYFNTGAILKGKYSLATFYSDSTVSLYEIQL